MFKTGQASVEVVEKLAQGPQLIHDFGELRTRSLGCWLGQDVDGFAGLADDETLGTKLPDRSAHHGDGDLVLLHQAACRRKFAADRIGAGSDLLAEVVGDVHVLRTPGDRRQVHLQPRRPQIRRHDLAHHTGAPGTQHGDP